MAGEGESEGKTVRMPWRYFVSSAIWGLTEQLVRRGGYGESRWIENERMNGRDETSMRTLGKVRITVFPGRPAGGRRLPNYEIACQGVEMGRFDGLV